MSGPGQSYSRGRTHEVQLDIDPLVSTAWSKLLKELDSKEKGERCCKREEGGASRATRPTVENQERQETQHEAAQQVPAIFE